MRLIRNIGRIVGLSVLSVSLANCGGGGASTPVAPATQQKASSPTAQSVVVKINIPGRTPAGIRRTTYVGAGTQSATFLVTPAVGTPSPSVTANCTTTCQATLSVYPGSNTFTVSLYDGANGSGNLISSGSTTQTIAVGTTTAVNLTFNGVPASVSMSSNPISFTSGTPGTSAVTVSALDADGNTIIAPGNFSPTIALTSDTSSVTLSPTTLTAPGQNVTATYDGTPVGTTTNVTFSAAIGTSTPVGSGGVTIVSAPALMLDNNSVTVTAATGASHTATVTVSETGYNGAFSIPQNQCSANASISPSSGTGPSQVFTITGISPTTFPLPNCSITFSDTSSNTVTLTVTVN